jgi:hypothetical protein
MGDRETTTSILPTHKASAFLATIRTVATFPCTFGPRATRFVWGVTRPKGSRETRFRRRAINNRGLNAILKGQESTQSCRPFIIPLDPFLPLYLYFKMAFNP